MPGKTCSRSWKVARASCAATSRRPTPVGLPDATRTSCLHAGAGQRVEVPQAANRAVRRQATKVQPQELRARAKKRTR